MGSNLYTGQDPSVTFRGVQVWLSYARMIAGAWRWMGLEADGVTPQLPWVGPLEPGGPVLQYYLPILDYFRARGWDVYTPDLDWRQVLALDGGRLADLISRPDLIPPVHLIAHSRGGLVTRQALAILRARGQLGRLGRVVGAGVPHQGSLDGAGLLGGWAQAWRLLFELITLGSGPAPFLPIFGSLRDITTTWPVSYQLIPAPFSTWLPAEQIEVIYDPSQWVAIKRPVSAELLGAARVGWASLPLPPASIPWLDLVGVGFATAGSLASLSPPAVKTDCTWSADGDGIVVVESAVLPDHLRVSSYTSHNALVHDYRIMPYLEKWFRGELSQNVTITDGPIE